MLKEEGEQSWAIGNAENGLYDNSISNKVCESRSSNFRNETEITTEYNESDKTDCACELGIDELKLNSDMKWFYSFIEEWECDTGEENEDNNFDDSKDEIKSANEPRMADTCDSGVSSHRVITSTELQWLTKDLNRHFGNDKLSDDSNNNRTFFRLLCKEYCGKLGEHYVPGLLGMIRVVWQYEPFFEASLDSSARKDYLFRFLRKFRQTFTCPFLLPKKYGAPHDVEAHKYVKPYADNLFHGIVCFHSPWVASQLDTLNMWFTDFGYSWAGLAFSDAMPGSESSGAVKWLNSPQRLQRVSRLWQLIVISKQPASLVILSCASLIECKDISYQVKKSDALQMLHDFDICETLPAVWKNASLLARRTPRTFATVVKEAIIGFSIRPTANLDSSKLMSNCGIDDLSSHTLSNSRERTDRAQIQTSEYIGESSRSDGNVFISSKLDSSQSSELPTRTNEDNMNVVSGGKDENGDNVESGNDENGDNVESGKGENGDNVESGKGENGDNVESGKGENRDNVESGKGENTECTREWQSIHGKSKVDPSSSPKWPELCQDRVSSARCMPIFSSEVISILRQRLRARRIICRYEHQQKQQSPPPPPPPPLSPYSDHSIQTTSMTTHQCPPIRSNSNNSEQASQQPNVDDDTKKNDNQFTHSPNQLIMAANTKTENNSFGTFSDTAASRHTVSKINAIPLDRLKKVVNRMGIPMESNCQTVESYEEYIQDLRQLLSLWEVVVFDCRMPTTGGIVTGGMGTANGRSDETDMHSSDEMMDLKGAVNSQHWVDRPKDKSEVNEFMLRCEQIRGKICCLFTNDEGPSHLLSEVAAALRQRGFPRLCVVLGGWKNFYNEIDKANLTQQLTVKRSQNRSKWQSTLHDTLDGAEAFNQMKTSFAHFSQAALQKGKTVTTTLKTLLSNPPLPKTSQRPPETIKTIPGGSDMKNISTGVKELYAEYKSSATSISSSMKGKWSALSKVAVQTTQDVTASLKNAVDSETLKSSLTTFKPKPQTEQSTNKPFDLILGHVLDSPAAGEDLSQICQTSNGSLASDKDDTGDGIKKSDKGSKPRSMSSNSGAPVWIKPTNSGNQIKQDTVEDEGSIFEIGNLSDDEDYHLTPENIMMDDKPNVVCIGGIDISDKDDTKYKSEHSSFTGPDVLPSKIEDTTTDGIMGLMRRHQQEISEILSLKRGSHIDIADLQRRIRHVQIFATWKVKQKKGPAASLFQMPGSSEELSQRFIVLCLNLVMFLKEVKLPSAPEVDELLQICTTSPTPENSSTSSTAPKMVSGDTGVKTSDDNLKPMDDKNGFGWQGLLSNINRNFKLFQSQSKTVLDSVMHPPDAYRGEPFESNISMTESNVFPDGVVALCMVNRSFQLQQFSRISWPENEPLRVTFEHRNWQKSPTYIIPAASAFRNALRAKTTGLNANINIGVAHKQGRQQKSMFQ